MRIFSTFSGIGGFEVGIRNAIESYRKTQQTNADSGYSANDTSDSLQEWGQSATFVGYSEIDKYASSVYERNFNGSINFGDITKINEKELPDFDCLVGGFPCQAFSIAGKRRGFEDTRGTLFFDLARILRAKQPRLFVFENVKGLLSHCDDPNKPEGERSYTFPVIIETLDELGYDCQWQVLNSKNHGVPQNRERIIIVGHRRGTPRPEVFPITGTSESDIVLPTLTTRYAPAQANGGYIGHESKEDRSTIKVPEATKKGYAVATVGQAINLAQPNSKTRRGRVSDIANTLDTSMQQHTLTQDVRIRRLTPVETERLQGFHDNWTKYGKDGELISDTQRYKMCGNAVTTNVVQAVFERLFA